MLTPLTTIVLTAIAAALPPRLGGYFLQLDVFAHALANE